VTRPAVQIDRAALEAAVAPDLSRVALRLAAKSQRMAGGRFSVGARGSVVEGGTGAFRDEYGDGVRPPRGVMYGAVLSMQKEGDRGRIA